MRFEIFETVSENLVLALLVTCVLIGIDIVHSIAVHFINKFKHNEVWFSEDAPIRRIDPFKFRVTYGILRISLIFHSLVIIVSLADWYFIKEGFNFIYAFIYGSINIFLKTKEMFFDNKVWFAPKIYGSVFAEVHTQGGDYLGLLCMSLWDNPQHYPDSKIESSRYDYHEEVVGEYKLKFLKVPGLNKSMDTIIDDLIKEEKIGKSVVDATLFRQPFFDPIYPLIKLYSNREGELLEIIDRDKNNRDALVNGLLTAIGKQDSVFLTKAGVKDFLISKKADLPQLLHASSILLSPTAGAMMQADHAGVKDLLQKWFEYFGYYDIILMNDGVMDREHFISEISRVIHISAELANDIRRAISVDISDKDMLRRRVLAVVKRHGHECFGTYRRIVGEVNLIIDKKFISNK